MKILHRNANGVLTQDDHDLADKKFSRLNRYFEAEPTLELVYSELRGWCRVEVTFRAGSKVLRAAADRPDFRSALDEVVDHCELQLAKLKEKQAGSRPR